MAIQKLWYVVALNQQYVPLEFGVGNNEEIGLEGFAAPPRGGRAARPAPIANNQAIKLGLETKKGIKEAFTSEESAVSAAKLLATKFPKEPFGVLGIVSVFETVPADPIQKSFNDTGELVVIAGV